MAGRIPHSRGSKALASRRPKTGSVVWGLLAALVAVSTASAQGLTGKTDSAAAAGDVPIRTAPLTTSVEAWVNNLGEPQIGSGKAGLGVYYRGPNSAVEEASASLERALNGRSQAVAAALTVAPSHKLKLFAAGATTEVRFPSGASTIHASSDVIAGGVLLTLAASRRQSAEAVLQVVSKQSDASVGELVLLDERVSVARLTYEARWKKPSRVDALRVSLMQSLPDATSFGVDRRTRSGLATYAKDFGTVSARYEGAYRLSRASEVFISAGGQYGWAPIPYAFKFAYGGAGYGGAFDPDALVGDSGVSGAIELRRSFWDVGPVTAGRAYVRLDGGWVRSRSLGFAPPEDRAASVGVGLKADLTKRLSVQVEYNHPVAEPRFARPTGDRILFEIIARAST